VLGVLVGDVDRVSLRVVAVLGVDRVVGEERVEGAEEAAGAVEAELGVADQRPAVW